MLSKITNAVILALILSSCAQTPKLSMPEDFDPNGEDGLIALSIAIKNEKPIFNGYHFYYIGDGIEEKTYKKRLVVIPAQVVKMKFRADLIDGNKAVHMFYIKEPEGNYQFIELGIFSNSGFVNSRNNIPMEINFSTEKGKAKYLGEIYLDYRERILELSDERERDLKLIKQEYPDLIIESVN